MAVSAVVALVVLACACGPKTIWTGRTADRLHRVDVMRDGGLDFVMIDGHKRAAYRGVAGWSIALAGEHIAFAARVGREWIVVHDERMSREKWDAIGELRLTADNRLVYVAERAGGWHVVVDGAVGPRVGAVLASTLTIAGAHVAYVADLAARVDDKNERGTGARAITAETGGRANGAVGVVTGGAVGGTAKPARVRAFVDAKPGPLFDGIGQLSVAADGRYAYAARTGLDAYAVIDGKIGMRCDGVAQLQLGPRGHAAYVATLGDDQHLVVDGDLGATVDSISRVVFRDDGEHVAWIGHVGGSDVLALDDTPLGTWAHRSVRGAKLAFRPTAATNASEQSVGLAYVFTGDQGERMIVDGAAGAVYDEVRTPVWSTSGRLAYAARRGMRWLIVDGERELDGGDTVGDPVLAGQRLAFAGRRGNQSFVVVDGNTFAFDLVFEDTLAFSADGTRWGVIAGDRKREQLFIAIDGTRKVPITVRELYSAAASGGNDATLRTWIQTELDRPPARATQEARR